ncbi:MAG: DUF4136 domain-containing protein [Proteobacteria bacterium]|nr:DUF4136 domain-containing protein [Pseudomonadota bacterium]
MNRRLLFIALGAGSAWLAGCASVGIVTSDVSSFGEWPAGRQPGSYAFERLPSQQAQTDEATMLEQAAAGALAKAGFKPAAAGQEPDVLVQLGARFLQSVRAPWDDPLWWGGGFGRFRNGPWMGPSWSMSWRYQSTVYQQDVAILLRDRASGKPLFEARASNDGTSRADAATVAAMFEAALMDFPKLGINPRRVTVTLPPPPPPR